MASVEPARPAPPPDDENTPEYREWLAAAYDTDVYEQWLRRFEDLLQRRIEPLGKGMALEVGCATGRGTARLLEALGGKVRLVAQEDRSFLLDLARARLADQVGSRLFFNSDPLPRLRYDEKVFSTVAANLCWWERPDRVELLSEMARVLDVDGHVVLTAPLAGTFGELIDLAREVAVKLDVAAKLEPRIAALEALFATPEDWAAEVARAGLVEPRVETEEFELRFASSRELFSSTLAQARWVGLWRRAFGEEDKRLVWHVRQMIDAYWADAEFSMTVVAGSLVARRPEGWSARHASERPPPGPEALALPIVLAGESESDRAPVRPTTIPPQRGDSFYASGDAIAADLLGLASIAPGAAPAPPRPAEPVEPITIEPETLEPLVLEPVAPGPAPMPPGVLAPTAIEPVGLDLESIDAEELEELAPAPAAAVDPLDEGEPYVPDDADLNRPSSPSSESRPSFEELQAALEDGSGLQPEPEPELALEGDTPVTPLPLGAPQAAPLAPIDLDEPQLTPLEPVDLDDLGPDIDDSIPDWTDKRR